MRRFIMAMFALFFFTNLVQAQYNAELLEERAKDLLCMRAKPWQQIQGLPYNHQAMEQFLSVLHDDPNLDYDLVCDLAKRWENQYGQDVQDALEWCNLQSASSLVSWEKGFWLEQVADISSGRLIFGQECEGVCFDDMRRWAYYWRFYGSDRLAPVERALTHRTSHGFLPGYISAPIVARPIE